MVYAGDDKSNERSHVAVIFQMECFMCCTITFLSSFTVASCRRRDGLSHAVGFERELEFFTTLSAWIMEKLVELCWEQTLLQIVHSNSLTFNAAANGEIPSNWRSKSKRRTEVKEWEKISEIHMHIFL